MAARPRRSTHHLARLRRHHLLLLIPLLLVFLLPPLPAVIFRRANFLGRRCLSLPAADHTPLLGHRLSFSIVMLSDESRGARGLSFRGMLNATTQNKRAYAAVHRYSLAV
jgi:hypothetical protein